MHEHFGLALTTTRSALFLDGWVSFNEEKWNYRAEHVFFQRPGREFPKLEALFYLDEKGRIVTPPRNPYLPLQFTPTPTEHPYRLYTQWLDVADMLAEDLLKRGFRGSLAFPPGFIDARPFQWQGQSITNRYTFVTSFPVDTEKTDASVRNKVKKAMQRGYQAHKTNNWEAINFCLSKTEEAKSFSHRTTVEDFLFLEKLLGEDAFRGYLCSTAEGEPVAGQIKLFLPGGISIDWSAGTDRDHIKNGVNQLLYQESCDDMAKHGGRFFDLCGANIRPVAQAKAAWGWSLMPYLSIMPHDSLVRKGLRRCVPQSIRPLLHKLVRM